MTLGHSFSILLQQARDGDEAAITSIYRDLAPLVIGYARGLGARDPEDVASETFIAVVKGLRRFQGDERQFRSWVLTITHRRTVDEVRRRQRRRDDPVEHPTLVGEPSDLPDPGDDALARVRVAELLAAVEQLTPDQRSVLLLRTLADLPLQDVADVLGKEVTAVKALQRRAVAALRRLVDQELR